MNLQKEPLPNFETPGLHWKWVSKSRLLPALAVAFDLRRKSLEFVSGDGEVPDALEFVAMEMKKKEKAGHCWRPLKSTILGSPLKPNGQRKHERKLWFHLGTGHCSQENPEALLTVGKLNSEGFGFPMNRVFCEAILKVKCEDVAVQLNLQDVRDEIYLTLFLEDFEQVPTLGMDEHDQPLNTQQGNIYYHFFGP